MALTKTPIELSSTPSIVDGGNATAITIDSSENVLVGKTALEYENTAGHIFRNDGFQSSTRSGGNVADFNRLSSDGEILRLSKDGTTVGVIGTTSANNFAFFNPSEGGIETAGVGILPMMLGVRSDNETDLGFSGARFKDIYLSGGAYLGGTGAANKLEDYEEGTFTATLNGDTQPSTLVTSTITSYTKIGNTVHCRIGFLNVNTTGYGGHISVSGLPFPTANGNLRTACVPAMYHIGAFTADYVVGLVEQSTKVFFYGIKTANSWNSVSHNAGGSNYLEFNLTYHTNA